MNDAASAEPRERGDQLVHDPADSPFGNDSSAGCALFLMPEQPVCAGHSLPAGIALTNAPGVRWEYQVVEAAWVHSERMAPAYLPMRR